MATHIKDIIAEFFRDSTAKKKEEDKVFEIINKTMAGNITAVALDKAEKINKTKAARNKYPRRGSRSQCK